MDNDISLIEEAIRLEIEADERYSAYQQRSKDPFIVAYIDGIRRNEQNHRASLEAVLRRIRES